MSVRETNHVNILLLFWNERGLIKSELIIPTLPSLKKIMHSIVSCIPQFSESFIQISSFLLGECWSFYSWFSCLVSFPSMYVIEFMATLWFELYKNIEGSTKTKTYVLPHGITVPPGSFQTKIWLFVRINLRTVR